MKADLRLEPAQRDPQRVARALTTAMAVGIEELHAHYLQGYGTVPASLASYLQTKIEEMLVVVKKINWVLDTPTKDGMGGS